MLRVLVTGSSGYLGKSILKNINRDEYNVFAGYKKKNEMLQYFDDNTYRYLYLNINNKELLKKKITDIRPNIIIHLAAFIPKNKDKYEYYKSYNHNLKGTRNLLEVTGNIMSVKKLIFASSISVYNNIQPFKQNKTESMECEPSSYYGLHKLKSEKYISLWAKKNKKSAIILRFNGIHGGSRKSGVIYNFCLSAYHNKIINVSSPNYYFSFLFLDDAVEACLASLRKEAKRGSAEIYNISGRDILSLKQLAIKIKKHLNKKNIKIICKNDFKINYSCLSIDKAIKNLDWLPLHFNNRLKQNIKLWGLN